MTYAFIQARNYYKGRRKKIRLIVWHDMEAPETSDTAENVARWFAGTSAPRASAHVCVDDDSAVNTVHLTDTAWHCPNANADGAGIELAGIRNQGHAGWRDRFSLATIARACRWVVDQPELAHIPDRWLTDAQLADGVTAGHTTHEQCTRVLGGGTHTDPGPDFPRDQVMAVLGQLRHPVTAPTVHPPTPMEGPVLFLAYATNHTHFIVDMTVHGLTKRPIGPDDERLYRAGGVQAANPALTDEQITAIPAAAK